MLKVFLNLFLHRRDIQKQITNLPYTGGSTNTTEALKTATNSVFNTASDRSDVPDLIVILTDGDSDNKV